MTPAPLLTPTDVASRLNVKVRAVYDKLAIGGDLHHLRIDIGSKSIRVEPDALEDFIRSRGVTKTCN